jgi:Xaa-Pro dipeptidase
MKIKLSEFELRRQRSQAKMQELGLDYLIIYSWKRGQIKYLSGYHPNYIANVAAILLPKVGEPVMFIRFGFDLERAQRESAIQDIRASGDLPHMVDDLVREIQGRSSRSASVGIVDGDLVMNEMPYSFYLRLQNQLPKCRFSDQRSLMMSQRLLKSEDEIEMIRRSARVADEGLRKAKDVVRAGNSETMVVASVESVLRHLGAENVLVVIAAPGSEKLIGPPSSRVLEKNEDVIIEIAVEVNGYWSQVAGIFFTQDAQPEKFQIRDAVYDTYRNIVRQVKPGVTCAQLAESAVQYLKQIGYADYIEQDFGHGVGLDMPEPPKIEPSDSLKLRTGHVLVIHPAIRVPGMGGAFIGGTVVLGKNGVEALHDLSTLL